MTDKNKKFNIFKPREKKFFRPVIFFSVFFMIFYLTYFAYQFFGVGDFNDWALDVAILFGIFVAVILLAIGVAWVLVKIRNRNL